MNDDEIYSSLGFKLKADGSFSYRDNCRDERDKRALICYAQSCLARILQNLDSSSLHSLSTVSATPEGKIDQ